MALLTACDVCYRERGEGFERWLTVVGVFDSKNESSPIFCSWRCVEAYARAFTVADRPKVWRLGRWTLHRRTVQSPKDDDA